MRIFLINRLLMYYHHLFRQDRYKQLPPVQDLNINSSWWFKGCCCRCCCLILNESWRDHSKKYCNKNLICVIMRYSTDETQFIAQDAYDIMWEYAWFLIDQNKEEETKKPQQPPSTSKPSDYVLAAIISSRLVSVLFQLRRDFGPTHRFQPLHRIWWGISSSEKRGSNLDHVPKRLLKQSHCNYR